MESQGEQDCTVSCASEKQGCCCPFSCLPKGFIDLVMWRDIKKTAPVFIGGLCLLYMLMELSFISAVAYSGLLILGLSGIALVLKKFKPQWVENCPFTCCVTSCDGSKTEVTREQVERIVDAALPRVNAMIACFHEAITLGNLTETAKFVIFFWILTCVGDYFNLLTLVTIVFVLTFTLPRVYEQFQPQFDNYGAIAKQYAGVACKLVHEKFGSLTKKAREATGKKEQ